MAERPTATAYRRSARLAVLIAAAALALAACSSAGGAPHVASLANGSGYRSGSTTATLPHGNPTQLLDEWASCMRAHGDPNQADPTIDANQDIDIGWDPATTGGIYGTLKGGQGNSGPGQYCRAYLNAAQMVLGGDQPPPAATNHAMLLEFAQCMRTNGIADFPDPVGDNLTFNMGAGGDLSPKNPAFQSAAELCARKTGVPVPFGGGTPPPGVVKLNGAGPLP